MKDHIRKIADDYGLQLTKSLGIYLNGELLERATSDFDLLTRLCQITGAEPNREEKPAPSMFDSLEVDPVDVSSLEFLRDCFKMKPYDHQLKALGKSHDKSAYFLAHDMGTGKTATTLANITHLYRSGEISQAVILAPNGVHREWIDFALDEHVPDDVERTAAYWAAQPNKKEKELLTNMEESDSGLRLFAANIEAIGMGDRCYAYLKKFLTKDTLLVVDESTRIKSQKAKRTKRVLEMGRMVEYRRCLSGTPVTKGPLDLYTQYHFLDPGFWDSHRFRSFIAFRQHFAVMREDRSATGRYITFPVGYRNLDELAHMISPITDRVLLRECVDLPPLVRKTEHITLTKDQRKIYDGLKKDLYVEMAQGEISADHLLTKLIRLSQITGGFIKLDGETETRPIEGANPKLTRLLDILEDLKEDAKVVIWAAGTHEIEAMESEIRQKFGTNSVMTYYGETSKDARAEAKEAFRAGNDHEARFLVGNAKAGGIGLNFTGANVMIYYSNNYDADQRWQSERRFERIGQTRDMVLLDLVALDTIDESVVDILRSKKQIADVINKDTIQEMV